MSSCSLLDLPPELLLVIIGSLPICDILKCRQLCHGVNDLLANSTTIQYGIELFKAFLREDASQYKPESSLAPIGDRLHLLKEVNEGWRDLKFVRSSVIEYSFPSSHVYELSGGRFVMGTSLNSFWLNQLNRTHGLYVYRLPSRSDELEVDNESQKSYIKLDSPITDFAMDVTQNLLVLMERQANFAMTFHLRTFDANTPHPDAAVPELSVGEEVWGATVHISGSILVALFPCANRHETNFLMVWDWTTGDLIGRIVGTKLKYCVLLTPTSFVVANLDQEALDVYEVDAINKSLVLLQRLMLPGVTGDEDERPWVYEDALLRSHPNPPSLRKTQTPPGPVSLHTDLPFTTDENDGIVVCTFQSGVSTFTLITHRSSLVRPYNKDLPPRTTAQGQVVRLIPWSDWGPSNCRSLKAQNSMHWICYVHGHRFATLEPRIIKHDGRSRSVYDSEEEDDPFVQKTLSAIRRRISRMIKSKEKASTSDNNNLDQEPEPEEAENSDNEPYGALAPGTTGFYALRVFDFNPRNIRTAKAAGIPTSKWDALSKDRVNKGQLLVEEPSPLRGRVPTALPYLETTVRLRDIGLEGKRKKVEGVMMNGECVIFMMADGWHDVEGVEVRNV